MPQVDISVDLILATADAERHIERSGREAYGSAESSSLTGTRQ